MSLAQIKVPCCLYILQSEISSRYYVGISADPQRRLEFHNSKERGFTSRYRPWTLVYVKQYSTRKDAQQAEQKVKSWKSRIMIGRLVTGEISL